MSYDSNENKYQEYKEIIKNNYPPSNYTMLRTALDVCMRLLDKQIPKKDLDDDDCCLYAYGTIGEPTNYDYCPYCGRKLDRSEEDEI